jgi:hypothetical protein
MSMSLLTEFPRVQNEAGQDGLPHALESSYLLLRSWIAVLEGRGLNSLDFLRARTVLALFEIANGIFSAAYISIGSLFRAADALSINRENQKSDYSETWRGILILDRQLPHSSVESLNSAHLGVLLLRGSIGLQLADTAHLTSCNLTHL